MQLWQKFDHVLVENFESTLRIKFMKKEIEKKVKMNKILTQTKINNTKNKKYDNTNIEKVWKCIQVMQLSL